jgi:hypothetical protein
VDNCGFNPIICIKYLGNDCYTNGITSYLLEAENCTPIVFSCGTGNYEYTVSSPGFTTLDGMIEVGQTYGNVNVTISVVNAPNIFEVFVGNSNSNVGEVFVFTQESQTITKTVGFLNYGTTTSMDVQIYAENYNSNESISTLLTIAADCPTLIPCEIPNFYDFTSDLFSTFGTACNSIQFNPDATSGNNTTFCNSTTFTNPSFGLFYPTGNYYISYNGQYREVSVVSGNDTVTTITSCSNCTTSTPTATNTVTPTPTTTTNLGISPSVTPTNTTTPTLTPTVTQSRPICYNYVLGTNSFSTTYQWIDCNGETMFQFVPANTSYGPICSRTTPTGGIYTITTRCS